jgi:hypothetical protein
MTDADTIAFLEKQLLLEQQRRCDAECEIKERDQAIARQAREFADLRRRALEFDDSARLEDIAQALEEGPLRRSPMARRQALADLIRRPPGR